MQKAPVEKHATFQQVGSKSVNKSGSALRESASMVNLSPRSSRSFMMKKPSSLKKRNPSNERRVQIKLSILMIAKIKRMAARVKKQYLARHPHLVHMHFPETQNTFQVDPDEQETFNVNAAVSLLEYVVHFFFDDVKSYVPSLVARLAQSTSDDILRKCQNRLHYPRYKLVSHVAIFQRQENDGDAGVASRCVWDNRLDNYASFSHTIKNMYIVATLYAVYYE